VTTTLYEAESATLNGCTTATNHAGYTGAGFVDNFGDYGDYIEWTVTSAAAGAGTVVFRYANNSGAACGADVRLNGTTSAANVATNKQFAATGAWSTWADASAVNVTWLAGSNTVRLVLDAASGNGGFMNVDSLTADTPAGTSSALTRSRGVPRGSQRGMHR
jgi:hypothetical protein